ncbi:uncharacterized protein LACBIDRAFT_328473 [Laccaria bicolor S238N-H82]|uniref:Predicted protein n=1 Tax=Laccaria bicolor (strain S238N-H82 / ATCC MYA-4686) TaxID=486041 RepID=B0DEY1_LACBS|nr:uncharacterized protein LACBIDRAFT_328473 [Laccaria bicolor S238N-H82]EDR06750.1 predicted protein [Laccaria bicolor S238N-H82]|eukprot:XP_001882597.1 predicted protein [Laccaria bicolor S238N-H82]
MIALIVCLAVIIATSSTALPTANSESQILSRNFLFEFMIIVFQLVALTNILGVRGGCVQRRPNAFEFISPTLKKSTAVTNTQGTLVKVVTRMNVSNFPYEGVSIKCVFDHDMPSVYKRTKPRAARDGRMYLNQVPMILLNSNREFNIKCALKGDLYG